MYCQPASDSYKASLARMGHPNAAFYENKPLGSKTIAKLFKTGAEILGLPKNFCAHSLRSANITMLANDPSVSIKETMVAARHNSVSASMNYQRVDGISEGNRLRALGVKIPTREECSPAVLDKKMPAKPDVTATAMIVDKVPAALKVKKVEEVHDEVEEQPDELIQMTQEWSLVDIEKKHLESDDDSSFEEIILKGRDSSKIDDDDFSLVSYGGASAPSSTQDAMEQLKDDLAELKLMMENENKVPPVSKNMKVIESLRSEVKGLKRKLVQRENEVLYEESMEMALERELADMKKKLKRERVLRESFEREKNKIEEFVKTRFPRSHPKRKDWKKF